MLKVVVLGLTFVVWLSKQHKIGQAHLSTHFFQSKKMNAFMTSLWRQNFFVERKS